MPDSQSIPANIRGEDRPTDRDSIYATFYSQIVTHEQRMVRTRTRKLVFNRTDIGELYDLVNDPWERRNPIDLPETREVQAALLDRMPEHMVRLDDPVVRAFDTISHVY